MAVRDLYLAGVRTVRAALVDPAVVAAWEEPSALEDQTVGSLAGHLARTGTWIVDEFLGDAEPEGPVDFDDAATFYATLLPMGDGEDPIHQGIRERGAALAALGPEALAATIDERMPAVEAALRERPGAWKLTVTAGNVMTLDVYLVTRLVEQVVHIDDLARSVDHEPWPLPPDAHRLVAQVAVDVAALRHGPPAVVRGLYRQGFADAIFPAI